RHARVEKVAAEPSRKSRRIAASSASQDARQQRSGTEDDANYASLVGGSTSQTLRRITAPQLPTPISDDFAYPPDYTAPSPTRVGGTLHFESDPHFSPNLTPEEMMRLGSFGGTFFRAFHSSILHDDIPEDYDEFPEEWYHGLDADSLLTREVYENSVNRYGVKAGQSLADWEKAGWIRAQDPRGWFQWYCRFYAGRRSPDDGRQIGRWSGVCGPNGRFKKALVKKVVAAGGGGTKWNDEEVAPVLRQTLQHWGYILTESDYQAFLS
ncbi:hypothetical protein DL93DRAFT_2050295, partial [Clavulina sp. PMI_390]